MKCIRVALHYSYVVCVDALQMMHMQQLLKKTEEQVESAQEQLAQMEREASKQTQMIDSLQQELFSTKTQADLASAEVLVLTHLHHSHRLHCSTVCASSSTTGPSAAPSERPSSV